MEPTGTGPARRLRPPRPAAPDPAGLADTARCLADAQRPVIVTARTGAHPAAVPSLVELAELLGCPVLDQRDRINFPTRHPLQAGGTAELLTQADVVLLLDTEVPWVPAQAAPPESATVLQIDIEPAKTTMPTWAYPVDLALTADTSVALPLLVSELRGLETPARAARWRERRERVAARLAGVREEWRAAAREGGPAGAADAMLQALNEVLPPSAIVLAEAVTNRPAVIRQIDREPGFLYDTGAPALGWPVAGALGVKLARPGSEVLAVCGDGSFNFSVPTAAMWSARRAGASFGTIILNNRAYRASRLPVQRLFPGGAADAEGSFPETDLAPAPGYVDIARAFGGDGSVVREPAEMAGAVEHCLALLAGGRCAVIDVQLPPP
jgi:acetolactate synthase-1/2/3 large subunit